MSSFYGTAFQPVVLVPLVVLQSMAGSTDTWDHSWPSWKWRWLEQRWLEQWARCGYAAAWPFKWGMAWRWRVQSRVPTGESHPLLCAAALSWWWWWSLQKVVFESMVLRTVENSSSTTVLSCACGLYAASDWETSCWVWHYPRRQCLNSRRGS